MRGEDRPQQGRNQPGPHRAGAECSPRSAHQQTYGTGWGGYILLEVDDPDAFGAYQAFHLQTYGHAVHVTWEPLFDMDRAFADTIANLR